MEMRDGIINFLRKTIFGPSIKDASADLNENMHEDPSKIYITGILVPSEESTSQEGQTEIKAEEPSVNDQIVEGESKEDSGDDSEKTVQYRQSTIGVSFFIPENHDKINLELNFGTYHKEETQFIRTPNKIEFVIEPAGIPEINSAPIKVSLFKEKEKDFLNLYIVRRSVPEYLVEEGYNGKLITVTLANELKTETTSKKWANYIFQTELKIKAEGFHFLSYPRPVNSLTGNEDRDERRNKLLYRSLPTIAIGHACAVTWDDSTVNVSELEVDFLPVYEIKNIVPATFDGISLSMKSMYDQQFWSNTLIELNKLTEEYKNWIDQISRIELPEYHKKALKENINDCLETYQRIKSGVELLKNNSEAAMSFRLMNRAMLFQQIRYAFPTNKLKYENKTLQFESNKKLPEINDPTTWSDWNAEKNINMYLGKWRPFQLAFILMNINGIIDPKSSERELVDLIWFPTGGGKTEAYLGLSAFTVFYNRLTKKSNSGTEIIMRYTLRLLTSQQFERASSLFCGMELIRQEFPSRLGEEKISIGLWVGKSLTPNTNVQAKIAVDSLKSGKNVKYPFVVLRCPCCSTQIGPVKSENGNKLVGIEIRGDEEKQVFVCQNGQCEYHKKELPLSVVDEQLYINPPTLIVGTVDKFAQIPWEPRTAKFFGIYGNQLRKAPSLIIQDELHLISGPLGSMVGIYETLIDYLCRKGRDEKPKIIASTATISRADDQINKLYNCHKNKVKIFPPPGINAGETFFSQIDNASSGRKYVNVCAWNSSSAITTEVRVSAALLQAAKTVEGSKEEKDAYYTLLSYYGTIRELGHAVTLHDSDIVENLYALQKRFKIEGDDRRYLNSGRRIELTSRKSGAQIGANMDKLKKEIHPNEKSAVEVCLATNMISVGLDIPRLGLMQIIGQPKSVSEYIQASSRVGRSKSRPGLVFTILNPNKARDRSYFERFQDFHSKFYSYVEPTSVTPFSVRVRERALHALVIAMNRCREDQNYPSSASIGKPTDDEFNAIKKFILKRLSKIEPQYYTFAEDELDSFYDFWKRVNPDLYGNQFEDKNRVLMVPFGAKQNSRLGYQPMQTPTSMRNVDKTCVIKLHHDEQ
jgi:hypothetical protein